MTKSLHARQHLLSSTDQQKTQLDQVFSRNEKFLTFESRLKVFNLFPLRPTELHTLQVNLGYQCNQTCSHCHVDAGPDRKEMMSKETMEECLNTLRRYSFKSLDITGGAPELNPNFRWFVKEARLTGIEEIIVRCNLTIILANPVFHDLPEFFSQHNVRIISSLPFYQASRTDRQRGQGVFDKSIRALKLLNEQGYGIACSPLILDLVYNPSGAFLPGNQSELEQDFKKVLRDQYGIGFNNLLAITNMPISRFLDYLIESGNVDEYMEKLLINFNPSAIPGLMCRNTISVDWNGFLFDCDFNQMLNLGIQHHQNHIKDFDDGALLNRTIAIGQHCFGCTAGAGSSCQGSMVQDLT